MTTTRHGSRGALTFLTVPLVLLVACLLGPSAARAQWTTSGNNTTTTNNVGVGTTSPTTIFHVRPAANVNMGFTFTAGGEALITAFNDGNTAAVPLIIRGSSIRFQDATLAERMRVGAGLAVGSGYAGLTAPTDGAIFQGNIGVGTSTPGIINGVNLSAFVPLHVQAATGRYVVVDSATSNSGFALNDSSQPVDNRLWAVTQGAGGGKLTFSAVTDTGVGSYKMVIDRAGNVGVGTTTPAHRLEVAGSSSRNTLVLTGDGDGVGYAGLRIQAQTTTNIPTNRTSGFVLSMRKDTWYGGDGSGPSFIIETGTKGGGFAAPFLITPTNDIILNSGRGAGGPAGHVPPYGNVGIGTHTPAHKLDVAGNVNASGLCLGGTCKTNWAEISGSDSQWTTSGSNIYFSTGSVGVGTNAPGARLDVGAGAPARGAYTDLLVGTGGNNPQLEFYGAAKSTVIAHDEAAGGLVFHTNGPAFAHSLFIGNTGRVGVGTISPSTKMQLGSKISDDASRVYDPNALMVVHQTPTSTATLNDPKPVLYLGRQGTPNQAYGAMATFSLSRYESAGTSNVGSRTRLDIGLTHDSFTDAGVMTLLSNGNVGVGTTSPAAKFSVSDATAWPASNIGAAYVSASNTVGAGLNLHATGTGGRNWLLVSTASGAPPGGGAFSIFDATLGGASGYRLVVDSTGNVGVGTNAPAHKLDVAGSVNASGLCLGGTCKTTWAEISGTGSPSQWTNSGSNIYFSTGSVGVGTNAPGARLDVGAGAPARGAYTDLLVGAGGNNPQLEFYGATKSTVIAHDEALGGLVFHTNGPAFAHSLFLHNGGNVGVGTTTPAQKLHVFGGNVFHQFSATAGSEYGFYTSIQNNHFTSNVYFDGQWKTMTAGKGAFISTAPLGGNAFSVYADNTSRAAGAASAFDQYMVVTMDGNVGVGNPAPAHRLDVAGSVNASGLCLGGTCKSNWAEISGSGSQWANSGSNIHFGSGSVGIGSGAANPAELLELNGPGEVKVRAAGTISAGIQFRETNGTLTWSEWQQYSDRLRLNTHEGATTRADVMSVLPDGRVGVGTAAPATRLHVAGDVTVDGNITAKYQDLAEWVPSTQKLRAGTVVVLDAERTNHVLASGKAYDTKVAGVVSEMPGIILGVAGDDKVKVATTGRVRVRVDATRGGILVGDLLVTSGVEGVAMKSIPVDLGGTPIHRPGTIIGKALEPLKGGVGEILVLLSLQ